MHEAKFGCEYGAAFGACMNRSVAHAEPSWEPSFQVDWPHGPGYNTSEAQVRQFAPKRNTRAV